MTNILDKFGVSQDALETQRVTPNYPPLVPGRTVHIDADFLAYQVSADSTKSFDEMKHNLRVAAESLRLLAGAEHTNLILTGNTSTKGGRYELAVQQEYQACRKGKEKPKMLYAIKQFMVDELNAEIYDDQEADDALAQAAHAAKLNGDRHLHVITSRDKDLRMLDCLFLDQDTKEIHDYTGYGGIVLDRSGKVAKVVGHGTAFFWAQMLLGDKADSIRGLPEVGGHVVNNVSPSAKVVKAKEVLKSKTSTPAAVAKAKATIAKTKPKLVGPVLAYDILKRCHTDAQAFTVVRALYKDYGERVGFVHWRTGEPVRWQAAFMAEARLLWMRRTKNQNDVIDYIKEIQK